ncbi:hypothetical protein B0H67DRAFT_325167 [Lasiosphaeris hirsuta]|uniref:SnoaL-like domain-containing protein n=1 Tax=Lasiosphaeris hirsuta TaxID=260670 RepID=A0AA40DP35_9PEZI|nr:hypothetical protein B0H67DRAFT_325167 [Lasiosphaeris hirsuta]
MHVTTILTTLAVLIPVFAIPTGNPDDTTRQILARQALAAPPPCVRSTPPPTADELKARFDKFVIAFVGPAGKKNITEAFEYIAADYINHNPAAKNGAGSAWGILSPIWQGMSHTYIRSSIKGDMSWVNYGTSQFGEIVDRFRWEGGCIAEHWDVGESYPASK